MPQPVEAGTTAGVQPGPRRPAALGASARPSSALPSASKPRVSSAGRPRPQSSARSRSQPKPLYSFNRGAVGDGTRLPIVTLEHFPNGAGSEKRGGGGVVLV